MTTTDIAVNGSGPAEIVPASRRKELIAALDPDFAAAYPALTTEDPLEELIEETLGEGGEIALSGLTSIKVPGADLSKQWLVPDENGDNQVCRTIIGIPVAMQARRSMWVSNTVSGTPPDCRSTNLNDGVGMYGPGSAENPSGKCKGCPMAARGSANKGTQASQCVEGRVLFLLTGNLLPMMVNVPPGSLKNFRDFGQLLLNQRLLGIPRPGGRKSWGGLRVEVELGLTQKTNPVGQEYNMVTFRIRRRLTNDELLLANAYGMWVDTVASQLVDQADEEAVTQQEDVPFDTSGLPEDEVPLDQASDKKSKSSAGAPAR